MNTETVYLGHDNSIDLILKSKIPPYGPWSAIDLSGVSKITLKIGSKLVESTNQASDLIRWVQSGYVTGEIRMFLGSLSSTDVPPNLYSAFLTVYDSSNDDGIVWGMIPLIVKADVEI